MIFKKEEETQAIVKEKSSLCTSASSALGERRCIAVCMCMCVYSEASPQQLTSRGEAEEELRDRHSRREGGHLEAKFAFSMMSSFFRCSFSFVFFISVLNCSLSTFQSLFSFWFVIFPKINEKQPFFLAVFFFPLLYSLCFYTLAPEHLFFCCLR